MAERSAALPSRRVVAELLDGDFARAGFEIDDVVIDTASRPPRITVVADGDGGLDLDTVADLSRTASQRLDSLDTGAFILEVTSPGVHRPLTEEKHFRRAHARRVVVTLTDGSTVTGRLGMPRDGRVPVVVRQDARRGLAVQEIALGDIAEAVVQVEFSPPDPREMELVGKPGKEAVT